MESQTPCWYLDHQRQYMYKQTIKQPCTDSLPLKRTTYCPLLFIFWPFDCLPLELRPLITPLISFNFSVTKIDSRYVELQLHGMRECLSVPPLFCFCFLFVASTTTYGEDNKKLWKQEKFEDNKGVFRRYQRGIQKIPKGYSEDTKVVFRRNQTGIQKIPMGYSEDTKGVFRR